MHSDRILVPGITALLIVGGGWATLEATEAKTEDVELRVRSVEIKQAALVGQAVELDATIQRLDRMEALTEKLAENQSVMMANQAAMCQATNARCK